MELGINNLWPTEVLYERFTNFKELENLQNYILSDYFSSSVNLTNSDKNCLFDFNNEITDNIDNYKLKSWIRGIKDKNSFLPYHNHHNSLLTSLFYILIDENDNNGQLIAFDPRVNANRGYFTESFKNKFKNVEFSPKTGDILIFPSFLYHHVEKNNNSTRILIAVDLI
jgi:transposase